MGKKEDTTKAGTAPVSPAKVKVEAISQIAVAVEDIEKTAWDYWDDLGIGPWTVVNWEEPLVYDRFYRGKRATGAHEKIALTQLGGVDGKPGCEFELVTPGKEPSIYRDFLDQRGGAGIHHIQFLVDSVDEVYAVNEAMAKFGFETIQHAKFGPKDNPGAFSYIDATESLGAIWEPVYMGGGAPGEHLIIPSDSKAVSNAKIKVPFISQVGIVVRDVEEACWNYWNLLGIGPWTVYDWEYPLVYDRKYHGKFKWARDKVALTQLGNVEFEVMAQVQGPSGYKEWMDKWGTSINHIQYLVDSVDAVYEHGRILEAQGFPPIGSGTFGKPAAAGAYLYADCNKKLGAIWEPVVNPGDGWLDGLSVSRTIPPIA